MHMQTANAANHRRQKKQSDEERGAPLFAVRVNLPCVRPTWALTNEVKVLCRKITVRNLLVIRR